MKSTIKFLVLTMLLVIAIAAFAGCAKPVEHNWTEATCTAPKTCTDCGATEGEALAHTEQIVAGKDATCTESGLTDGKVCSVCNATIVAQEEIPALDHDMIVDAPQTVTCTEAGLTEGAHCSRCDYKVEQTEVPALGHDIVVDAAVAPTCSATGLTEGSHCTRCDYKVAQEVVPALGHDMVIDAYVAPTCTTTGLTEGAHCTRCDLKANQTVLPALGHDIVVDAAVAPTCIATGLTEGFHCTRCDHKAAQEVVPALGHSLVILPGVAATCTEDGITEGEYCTVCDHKVEQTVIAALGHDIVTDEAVAPTCSAVGLTEGWHCSRCDLKQEQDKIPAIGHNWIDATAYAPRTCTNCSAVAGYPLVTYAAIGDVKYFTVEEAIAAAKPGDTIVLLDHAYLNYGAREAFGSADLTELVIDGRGFTLTLNQTNSDWASIGLANPDAKLILKEVTIEKTGYGDTTGAWNTHAIIFSCNVELTNVTVNNGIAVQNGATLTDVIINEANGYYGLWINGNGQSVTMVGGAINATNGGRGIKIADQYIDNPASINLTVNGTVFNTAKKAAVLVTSTAGAQITATNVDITNVAADSVNFVWVDEDRAAYFSDVVVSGASVVQENLESFVASVGTADAVKSYFKTFAEAIAAAQDGDVVKVYIAGTYNVPTGKNITITGEVDGVAFDMSKAVGIYASMTFNNVTFNYGTANYKGLQHAGTMVYNNCIINGQVFLYGASETFNNCTFNQTSSGSYNVWTYSAKEVVFNGCTLNSAGKSVLVYAESAGIYNNVTFIDTILIASEAVDGKAAIEIDTSLTAGAYIAIDGTYALGFADGSVSGNALWNNKKGNEGANNDVTIVIDGVIVLDHIHFIIYVAPVAPTCSQNGNIAHLLCTACGQAWLDAACTVEIDSADVIIPAEPHTYTNCADTDCDVCGATREPVAHNITYVAAVVPANCLETGHDGYWICSACGVCFGDAEGSYEINPAWIHYTGDCQRPADAADCATVPCTVCGNDLYGYGDHETGVAACQDGHCSKCDTDIYGYGCANYDTPACEDGVCYYCGGFVAGFGHENGAWAACCDGECSYGCGLKYPASESHADSDEDDFCDNCWTHLNHDVEPCLGGECSICWMYIAPAHEYFYPCDAHCMNCYELTNPDASHNVSFVKGYAATCTEMGMVDYWTCSDCGAAWLDEACTMVANRMSVIIPATGHAYMFACDAHCMNCGELTNENASHNVSFVEGYAATCTALGMADYWTCSDCGAAWLDEGLTLVANRMSVIIPMADHEYFYPCDAHCMNCYELTNPDASHNVSFVEGYAATCTEIGMVDYWTCSDCGAAWLDEACTMVANRMSVMIPAIGHSYVEDVIAPTCTLVGYTEHACENCDDVYNTDEVPALGHADENSDYKCDKCSTKVLPAAGEALTIPQAIAIGKLFTKDTYTTQKYYITGIVTNVYNTTYGNLYLKDADGNQICIYGLYSADGKTRYDAMSYKPVEGDELTVYTVLGFYTEAQGKNAWIDEVVAHEHNYTETVTAPTCTNDGYTTFCCTICAHEYKGNEVDALGHTTENGTCERCGNEIGGDAPVAKDPVTFEFGANGSAAHVDGNDFGSSKTYTEGSATLKLTGMSKVFGPAYDAKGNSCIKLGTSKVIGKFTFTVDEDVTSVTIYVAGYKDATSTNIKINGTAYTVKTTSNNGAYTAIEIDTTTTKTITFETVTYRCMINSITYNYD